MTKRKIFCINQELVNKHLHSLMYYEFDSRVEGLGANPNEEKLTDLEEFESVRNFIEHLFDYGSEIELKNVYVELGNERTDEIRANYDMIKKSTKEEMLYEISQMSVEELRELLDKRNEEN